MTDRTPDVYLQAILNTLQGNDPGDVPPANWNYEQYLVAILNELRNGSGGLPPVTESDNGKVATVAGGAWTAQQKKFVVTLTPTALDYSGTMDKTVAEISAAYEAGQEIWFNISALGVSFLFPLKLVVETSNPYPAMQSDAIMPDTNRLVVCVISSTDDGTLQTYGTAIYTLTPAT